MPQWQFSGELSSPLEAAGSVPFQGMYSTICASFRTCIFGIMSWELHMRAYSCTIITTGTTGTKGTTGAKGTRRTRRTQGMRLVSQNVDAQNSRIQDIAVINFLPFPERCMSPMVLTPHLRLLRVPFLLGSQDWVLGPNSTSSAAAERYRSHCSS